MGLLVKERAWKWILFLVAQLVGHCLFLDDVSFLCCLWELLLLLLLLCLLLSLLALKLFFLPCFCSALSLSLSVFVVNFVYFKEGVWRDNKRWFFLYFSLRMVSLELIRCCHVGYKGRHVGSTVKNNVSIVSSFNTSLAGWGSCWPNFDF